MWDDRQPVSALLARGDDQLMSMMNRQRERDQQRKKKQASEDYVSSGMEPRTLATFMRISRDEAKIAWHTEKAKIWAQDSDSDDYVEPRVLPSQIRILRKRCRLQQSAASSGRQALPRGSVMKALNQMKAKQVTEALPIEVRKRRRRLHIEERATLWKAHEKEEETDAITIEASDEEEEEKDAMLCEADDEEEEEKDATPIDADEEEDEEKEAYDDVDDKLRRAPWRGQAARAWTSCQTKCRSTTKRSEKSGRGENSLPRSSSG